MAKGKKSSYLIGVGVAAAAVAGVVGFLTKTKKGQQLAKQGYREMVDLGRMVAHRAEKVRNMTRERYEDLVDEVVAEYERKKKLTKATASELAAELKKEWNKVKSEMKK